VCPGDITISPHAHQRQTKNNSKEIVAPHYARALIFPVANFFQPRRRFDAIRNSGQGE
jgi:hypothetical protein